MRKVFNRNEGKITITDPLDSTKSVAITSEGRLSVDMDSITQKPLKVSAPIIRTKHYFDSTIVENTIDNTTETLYKTYTNIAGHYLRELMICLEKKEVILYIYIDGIIHSEIDMEGIYDYHKFSDDDSFSNYFGVNKNKLGLYTVRFLYDNTPVDTNIELKLKYNTNTSNSVKMEHVIIVYNEAVE